MANGLINIIDMKKQILKIAGVKSEKEFYKKFPTEEAFMAKHGGAFKKAQMGESIEKAQLGGAYMGLANAVQSAYPYVPTQLNPPPVNPGMQFMNMPNANPNALTWSSAGNQPAPQAPYNPNQFRLYNTTQNYGTPVNQGKIVPPPSVDVEVLQKKFNPDTLTSAVNATSIVGRNIEKVRMAKEQLKNAKRMQTIAPVVLQAANTREEDIARRYVRPEDQVTTGEPFFPVYGVGTNVMAKDGAEIANTFAPNTLYDDLGYEPLDDSERYKQYYGGGEIPKAQLGDILNVAGAAADTVGDLAALAIQKKTRKINRENQNMFGMANFHSGAQGIQNQYTSFMKDGGTTSPYEWVSHTWQPQVITTFGEHKVKDLLKPDPTMDTLRAGGHLKEYTPPSEQAMSTERPMMQMGGELQTHWGGYAEPVSYNPYLPDGGETVMFRGQSHDESDGRGNTGIGITYGENPVEVERGEPAVKLKDGGDAAGDSSLVVFGNLKIPDAYTPFLGEEAKGKKFKSYVADLSKKENKQNKRIDKSVRMLDELDVVTPIDKLTFNSLQYNMIGANEQLKELADKKIAAASLQNAINDTAEQHGLIADDLAMGRVKIDKNAMDEVAKFGKSLAKARDGIRLHSALEDLQTLLNQKGYNFRITSGYRPGAKTAQGNESRHAKKEAIDVAFPDLGEKAYDTLLRDPEVVEYMLKNGLTVINEYDPEIRKKTKGTGPHLHIGFDKGTKTADQFRKDAVTSYKEASSTANNPQQAYSLLSMSDDDKKPKKATAIDLPSRQRKTGDFYGGVTQTDFEKLKKNNPWYDWKNFNPKKKSDVEDFQMKFNELAKQVGSTSRLEVDGQLGKQTVSAVVEYDGGGDSTPARSLLEKSLKLSPEEEKKKTEQTVTPYKRNPYLDALSQIAPYIRPSNMEGLDTSQLAGEMYALATNQLEPVQAQTVQPQLSVPYDISLQDSLNENEATFRSQQRMVGYNPALQSQLSAQKYAANQKVLGEQFRMNQAMKDSVYRENRGLLNQAQLQNLAILDTQYQRQQQAKSNTKAITQAALSSISDKFLRNQLENRTLATMENMYNYRFGPNFRAINMNPLYQAEIPTVYTAPDGKQYQRVPVTDQSGNVIAYQQQPVASAAKQSATTNNTTGKTGKKIGKKHLANGSILKAYKNL